MASEIEPVGAPIRWTRQRRRRGRDVGRGRRRPRGQRGFRQDAKKIRAVHRRRWTRPAQTLERGGEGRKREIDTLHGWSGLGGSTALRLPEFSEPLFAKTKTPSGERRRGWKVESFSASCRRGRYGYNHGRDHTFSVDGGDGGDDGDRIQDWASRYAPTVQGQGRV